ncbi:AraC family transcriptional regulator [Glutamicibacter halophytocola]|uniref:AraC family transcriptional regulator n=1 Tax=Glutamicibacter halophytocola TaxID=1933880 RepID=UPI001558AD3F|nr:AraC family transcriptional regulator [Glutamicibacter halophytocola]NQD42249.1 AraC family transcriptional regulator [Glutamicibacter halophytocola]
MVVVSAPQLSEGKLHKSSLTGWGDAVNDVHTQLSFKDDSNGDFSGVMSTSSFGEFRACSFSSTALTAYRTKRDVARGTEGTTIMLWQFRGTSVARQMSNEVVLSPGSIAFLDLDTPYEVQCGEGYGQLVVHLPTADFLDRVRGFGIRQDHRGMSLPEDPRAMPWLALLGTSFAQAQITAPGTMDGMYWPAVEAVAALAGLAVGASQEQSSAIVLASAAREIMKKRYWEADFTAEELAREMCVSRRTLFRAFDESQESFSEILKEIRLSAAARSLQQPALSLTLEGVGRMVGFASASTFYTRFREKFGVSPGAYRRQFSTGGTAMENR